MSVHTVAYQVAEGAPQRFLDSSDEGRLFLRTQPCKKVHGSGAYLHLASREESIENMALRLIAMLPDQLLFAMKSSGDFVETQRKEYSLDWDDGNWICLDDYLSGQQGVRFSLRDFET